MRDLSEIAPALSENTRVKTRRDMDDREQGAASNHRARHRCCILTRARQLSRHPWQCAKSSHKCGRDATPYMPCIPSRSRPSQPRHSTHSQLPHSVCRKPCLRRHRFHWRRRYCHCHCRRRHQEPASVCMCAFCAHHGRPHSSFHCVPGKSCGYGQGQA